jgi:predicted SAM-dependent methyltransferase
MKLNIACGKQTWPDFFCVDAVRHPKASRDPDLIHAFEFDVETLVNPLPLKDECADEVHALHFIEHVREYEAPALVREFHRLLKPRGLLVLELPNIEAAARNLLDGMPAQMCWFAFYGDASHRDPYMLHKFGYTPKTIKALLVECGFIKIELKPPQTHGARANRDMRVEARKA